MSKKEDFSPPSPTLIREHLNLRLIVVIPVVFILVSLSVALMAMTLTQFILHPPEPSAKDILVLHLWIVGSSLLAPEF